MDATPKPAMTAADCGFSDEEERLRFLRLALRAAETARDLAVAAGVPIVSCETVRLIHVEIDAVEASQR